MTLPEQKILSSLKWSSDRCVTVDGVLKSVRSAIVPRRHKFWRVWRERRDALKAEGYSVKKPDMLFIVCHWQTLEKY